VGSKQPDDRLAMAATVADRLFFAGEATSELYPASVHGAYLSGLEVANKVSSVIATCEKILK
jgi:monoamine oxidase